MRLSSNIYNREACGLCLSTKDVELWKNCWLFCLSPTDKDVVEVAKVKELSEPRATEEPQPQPQPHSLEEEVQRLTNKMESRDWSS